MGDLWTYFLTTVMVSCPNTDMQLHINGGPDIIMPNRVIGGRGGGGAKCRETIEEMVDWDRAHFVDGWLAGEECTASSSSKSRYTQVYGLEKGAAAALLCYVTAGWWRRRMTEYGNGSSAVFLLCACVWVGVNMMALMVCGWCLIEWLFDDLRQVY